MTDLQASVVDDSGYTLPPGWEAVESDKDHRIYYWNKKTGATTWKFPEHEAQQHEAKVRRHTYENMKPKTVIPSGFDLRPPPPANGNARSAKRGYENVALPLPQRPPQYEEVEFSGGMTSPNPLYGVGREAFWNNDSLAPNPTLPDRKYSDSDVQSPPPLLSPPPDLPDRRYSPSPELINIGGRKNSVHQPPPLHEVSALGNEYAIINRNRGNVGVAASPMRPADNVGVAASPMRPGDNVGVADSPMLPLRAQQRMSSREDILAACTIDVTRETSDHTSSPEFNMLGIVSDQISSVPKQAYQPHIPTERSEFEEVLPCPTSPRPYEVASPTTSSINLYTPSSATPAPSSATPSATPTPSSAAPSSATTPWPDPHYEEIEREEVVTGHIRTKPRAASSPEPATGPCDSAHSPTPHDNPLSQNDAVATYDLPLNSRKLMALNVTLRRTTTPSLTEYAKLSLSREALLLRSGVTLRRGRESLSSLSSFASRMEGEESNRNSGGGSSDEDVMEPLSRCIRNLETSLRQEAPGQDDLPDPEQTGKASGDFKMVKPQPSSPSWQNYQRRPHAYEDIVGASQEELDWDESDLPSPTSGTHEGEEGGPCVMIKVVDSPTKVVDPRKRVLHHQYEEVALATPTKEELQEGAGLPRGWQTLQDEQGKEYYWHIPTGKTQYSPPTMTKSPVFPAQYLGWIPVSEGQLIAGQCVKAVHTCINMMAASHQGEPHGEEVLLQVKGMALQWLEAGSLAMRTTQLINRIRVWGIGLEDERDFGYVSRDPITRKHRCHVFRCSMAARQVAHELLEAHQQQRNARSVSYTSKKAPEGTTPTSTGASGTTPTSGSAMRHGGHEHYERFSCMYIGACTVSKREGMEVLNEAVQRLTLSKNLWQDACVDVATSNIVIIEEKTGVVLKDHRVRYLSFLGIGRDDQFCGYILDSGQRKGEKCFTFYGFHMKPNTDRLCLALHSACQARYKRVREQSSRQETQTIQEAQTIQETQTSQEPTATRELPHSKSSSSLLGKKFGSLKKSKRTSVHVVQKSFMVQYLGHQNVGKVDGLDTVRPVVQELAMNPKPPCPHVVDFDISSAGLSFQDPQAKQNSAKKDFPVKSITYVVKIRNYFAFVAREKSKYICHVFAEFKVDAGTVVTTIQNTLTPAK